jgi:fluoride exporter
VPVWQIAFPLARFRSSRRLPRSSHIIQIANVTNLATYLWIALGGALGSVARYWCSGFVARNVGDTFPWGTLLVNVVGSFAIGLFATLTEPGGRWLISPAGRQFFMVGICGGYTTFSSFSLQTLTLAQNGEWLKAGANIVLSVVLCLVFIWLGHLMAAAINQTKGG